MPLNVRRFYTSVLLVLFTSIIACYAQQVGPSSGEVMGGRISKAKAFIAVRNYNAAIYELENIRRETGDATVTGVVNVLLMNSYLEQGDFKRAETFLKDLYAVQKTTSPNAAAYYLAVAGQVVSGARNRVERYRALGLSVSDRTLPLEASNDLQKMREMLELVIDQAKEAAKDDKKTADAIALVEEASRSRSMLGRDDYDSRRWRENVADTREELTNSRSVVVNAIVPPAGILPNGDVVAASTTKSDSPAPVQPLMVPVNDPNIPVSETKVIKQEPKPNTAQNNKPVVIPSAPKTQNETPKQADAAYVAAVKDNSPIDVGAELKEYATNQPQPIYPSSAKSMRAEGVVKVEVTIDESGDVAKVNKTSGPSLLQAAARDAIRKWKFRPFLRDGQPVKAIGYVSFNFNL